MPPPRVTAPFERKSGCTFPNDARAQALTPSSCFCSQSRFGVCCCGCCWATTAPSRERSVAEVGSATIVRTARQKMRSMARLPSSKRPDTSASCGQVDADFTGMAMRVRSTSNHGAPATILQAGRFITPGFNEHPVQAPASRIERFNPCDLVVETLLKSQKTPPRLMMPRPCRGSAIRAPAGVRRSHAHIAQRRMW